MSQPSDAPLTDAPLTDEEAQAVLVALSDPLEWRPVPSMPEKLGARAGQVGYVYHDDREKRGFIVAYCPDLFSLKKGKRLTIIQRCYDSAGGAKAACEWHHATGQWE